jgi:ABC-type hemin transport system substrate-binding protein
MSSPRSAHLTAHRAEPDDQGRPVRLAEVRRVVSLVPSLTESLAETAPQLLVGATDWCTHPPGLAVARIGGTKNPDVAAIIALAPDLVLANEEENRAADLDALRAAGLAVWVTEIRTLAQAFRSLDRMLTVACGLPRPAWLDQAEQAWRESAAQPAGSPDSAGSTQSAQSSRPTPIRAIVPIWRRPWMVLGRDTFAGDVLRRLGVAQIYADHTERYPAITLDHLRAAGAELVVLPDEPYLFTASDGPEAFPGLPCALVSGRMLTWYGPSLRTARTVLAARLVRPPG